MHELVSPSCLFRRPTDPNVFCSIVQRRSKSKTEDQDSQSFSQIDNARGGDQQHGALIGCTRNLREQGVDVQAC